MSITITSPRNGQKLKLENPLTIEGTADNGVVRVRVSSPIGNQDFPLDNVVVSEGKWSILSQFTLGGERKIVAEGFDLFGNEVADTEITIELDSTEDDPTGSVTISSPTKGSDLDLENSVKFTGTFSENVKKVPLRSPFMGQTFSLGEATLSGNNWTFSFKFNTGGQREVIADGLSSEGEVLGSAKVVLNLTSSLDADDFNVVGAKNTTQAFRQKVVAIANRINAKPLFLMAVMSFETEELLAPPSKILLVVQRD